MSKKNTPQIPETIIVELKEENENSRASAAGDYSTQLDEPIVIEEGDQVSIKSVFIDSNIPELGLVEVPPAEEGDKFRECSITTGFYLMNIPSSLETTFKVQTPADADAQRLVISKVYDPLLILDPTDTSKLNPSAGHGFAPSDTNETGGNTTVADQQNALNARMDGKPYVAMRVVKHEATDPSTHNFSVTSIDMALRTLIPFPGGGGKPAPLKKVTFKFLYYEAGPTGTNGKQKSQSLVFNFDTVSNTVLNKFMSTYPQRKSFTDDDGNTSVQFVIPINNDLFKSGGDFETLFTGSTVSFPFKKNNERVYIHCVTPFPPFTPPLLTDNIQANNKLIDLKTHGAVDTTPFSLVPITRTTNFKLECRKYVPDELARLISQKLSSVTSIGDIPADSSFLSNNGILATSRGLIINENPHLTEANLTAAAGATAADRGGDKYRLANITTPVVFARTLQNDPQNIGDLPELIQVDGDNIVDIFRMNDINTNSLNYIIGSQNFALEYDDDSQKFAFTSLHTPLYDLSDGTSGSSQIRQYLESTKPGLAAGGTFPGGVNVVGQTPPRIPARPNGKRFWVNKYSGCYITELNPPEIFYDGMRFSGAGNTKITTGIDGSVLCKDRNGTEMAVHGVPFNLVDGVNTTGDFDGVGAIVQRVTPHFPFGGTNPQPYDNKIKPLNTTFNTANPPVLTGPNDYLGQYQLYDVALQVGQTAGPSSLPPSYLTANEDRQVSIFANSHITDSQYQQVDNPYYKVEVKSKLKNNIEGDPSKNKFISAIISKYYSSGNYTSAYNEGSIVYTHRGMPEILDHFSVRILDNKGILAEDISTKNTVFLEILKSRST